MSKERGLWGSRLGFILAAAGSAIGLGAVWKFPYMVGAGGGGVEVVAYVRGGLTMADEKQAHAAMIHHRLVTPRPHRGAGGGHPAARGPGVSCPAAGRAAGR